MENLALPKETETHGHYYVKLPVFEGPFDLLFYLVNKEELDIHTIPLAKITRQYFQYLRSMQELEVEVAGEFLVMAASLLRIKSRLLLPQPPAYLNITAEEETLYFGSKEELVRSLLAYKRFKKAASILQERINKQKRIFLRDAANCRYYPANRLSETDPPSLENLKKAWLKLKEKNKSEGKDLPPKMVYFTPKTSFVRVLRWVVTSLQKNTLFHSCLDDFGVKGTREERVTVFTLFLELARRGRLSLRQEGAFSRIRILKPRYKGKEDKSL